MRPYLEADRRGDPLTAGAATIGLVSRIRWPFVRVLGKSPPTEHPRAQAEPLGQ